MKCEKITFRREATSVGKIPRFSGVSREQNVNKSWVNKQLTGMLAFWRLHMESSVVNKQLMKYPNVHIQSQVIGILFIAFHPKFCQIQAMHLGYLIIILFMYSISPKILLDVHLLMYFDPIITCCVHLCFFSKGCFELCQ